MTPATATTDSDYVMFSLLTGASQTITVTDLSGGTTFTSGFEIINTAPEPGTWALALVGGAGLLRAMRSRCRPRA